MFILRGPFSFTFIYKSRWREVSATTSQQLKAVGLIQSLWWTVDLQAPAPLQLLVQGSRSLEGRWWNILLGWWASSSGVIWIWWTVSKNCSQANTHVTVWLGTAELQNGPGWQHWNPECLGSFTWERTQTQVHTFTWRHCVIWDNQKHSKVT